MEIILLITGVQVLYQWCSDTYSYFCSAGTTTEPEALSHGRFHRISPSTAIKAVASRSLTPRERALSWTLSTHLVLGLPCRRSSNVGGSWEAVGGSWGADARTSALQLLTIQSFVNAPICLCPHHLSSPPQPPEPDDTTCVQIVINIPNDSWCRKMWQPVVLKCREEPRWDRSHRRGHFKYSRRKVLKAVTQVPENRRESKRLLSMATGQFPAVVKESAVNSLSAHHGCLRRQQ